jgi:hypothetical protein
MTTTGKNVAWKDRLLPTTTVHHARLQIFQPTRYPKFCTRTIKTPWGRAEITGRLGVMHALLLEAILFHAQKKRTLEGGVQVLVDPYHLRTTLSRAHGGYSGKGLKDLVRDLRVSAIRLDIPKLGVDAFVLDGFLNDVAPSPATVINPVTQERRHLWRVTLTKTCAAMLDRDLPLHYDPHQFAAFRTGTGAAVARWVLTHRDCPPEGWLVNTVLAGVGAEIVGAAGENRRRDLKKDREALAEMGIEATTTARIFRHRK